MNGIVAPKRAYLSQNRSVSHNFWTKLDVLLLLLTVWDLSLGSRAHLDLFTVYYFVLPIGKKHVNRSRTTLVVMSDKCAKLQNKRTYGIKSMFCTFKNNL